MAAAGSDTRVSNAYSMKGPDIEGYLRREKQVCSDVAAVA
jgi:hypothetical protein